MLLFGVPYILISICATQQYAALYDGRWELYDVGQLPEEPQLMVYGKEGDVEFLATASSVLGNECNNYRFNFTVVQPSTETFIQFPAGYSSPDLQPWILLSYLSGFQTRNFQPGQFNYGYGPASKATPVHPLDRVPFPYLHVTYTAPTPACNGTEKPLFTARSAEATTACNGTEKQLVIARTAGNNETIYVMKDDVWVPWLVSVPGVSFDIGVFSYHLALKNLTASDQGRTVHLGMTVRLCQQHACISRQYGPAIGRRGEPNPLGELGAFLRVFWALPGAGDLSSAKQPHSSQRWNGWVLNQMALVRE